MAALALGAIAALPSHAALAQDYALAAAAPAAGPDRGASATPGAAEATPTPAAVEQLRCCWDCKRPRRVLWATDDERGPLFCGACLSSSGSSRPAPSLGAWRPPAGVEDPNPHKAELGSFARPVDPPARPAPARAAAPPREAARDLWASISAGIDR